MTWNSGSDRSEWKEYKGIVGNYFGEIALNSRVSIPWSNWIYSSGSYGWSAEDSVNHSHCAIQCIGNWI